MCLFYDTFDQTDSETDKRTTSKQTVKQTVKLTDALFKIKKIKNEFCILKQQIQWKAVIKNND